MVVVGALMYFVDCTRPNILLAVKLLAWYSHDPTCNTKLELSKFSDIYKAPKIWVFSLTTVLCMINWPVILTLGSYLTLMLANHKHDTFFLVGGTSISWRSTKQTLVASSSNHAKILVLHEGTWECLWLQCLIGHIESSYGFI